MVRFRHRSHFVRVSETCFVLRYLFWSLQTQLEMSQGLVNTGYNFLFFAIWYSNRAYCLVRFRHRKPLVRTRKDRFWLAWFCLNKHAWTTLYLHMETLSSTVFSGQPSHQNIMLAANVSANHRCIQGWHPYQSWHTLLTSGGGGQWWHCRLTRLPNGWSQF